MPLSWNEIRHRAIAFAGEWKGETRESAERQTFWNEFFQVFGVRRRTVATFEEPVRKLSGSWGSIDLFWPGKLLVEHKSAGEDLGKAHAQGMAYIRGLVDTGRSAEVPRWLIVTDFARVALHDLEPEQDPDAPLFKRLPPSVQFPLADMHKCIRHFAFIAGYTQHRLDPEDPANLEATQLMCDLHDALDAGGYRGHELKRFLVRILFCLFAEDTGIFEQKAFELFILDRTASDGSDLGVRLEQLFRVLNTAPDDRQRNLDEDLSQFPYVNGDLFSERLEFAEFNAEMRNCLLACSRFRWELISPAVFGSLFQSVMDSRERRQIGAHYTAETNILKVVRSLFLDDLRSEFSQIDKLKGMKKQRLLEFQNKLAGLRFLDPACGCGNFLVITYRELRNLELEVLVSLHGHQHEMSLDEANKLSKLNVDQFYGIEIEEFPARIAEVALWLTDHQANIALSQAFSQLVVRLPLRSSPHIAVGNALRSDWHSLLAPTDNTVVLGNPPFIGHHFQSAEQKADQKLVLANISAGGVLDYVCNWYVKAAEYVGRTAARCAFVSTNSISQGEQPGILWQELFGRYHVKIHFGHRTFPWESEARGKAHVHCVIIGFGGRDVGVKRLTDYEPDLRHPTVSVVTNISPYLVEGSDRAVTSRAAPLCDVPKMSWGNKPTDGGHLIFSEAEKDDFLRLEPGAQNFVRPYMGGGDFIDGVRRYCLWLVGADPAQLRALPEVLGRVEQVRKFRLASKAATTREYATHPTLFRQVAQPGSDYLAIPEVSSERRAYIPIAFLSEDVICSNTIQFVPNATLFHFGVLTSAMHMAWMRQVCGRMKSDFRYSNTLVYNNFPWPQTDDSVKRAAIAAAAKGVLDARAAFDASLADLYDPLSMPKELMDAHTALDRIVDRAYRKSGFASERARVEFLFGLYETIASPLLPTTAGRRRVRR